MVIITYYRCCCCDQPFREKDKERIFCDRCSVIERDEHERELFERLYRVRIDDLKDWRKRVEFLKGWNDLFLLIYKEKERDVCEG